MGCNGWWQNLCVIIPTIKRDDLGGYEEITTCKSCSYEDPKFLHPQLQLQQVYLHIVLHGESGSLLITAENTTDKLSKQEFSFLCLRGLRPAPHRCSWPERCSFCFCVFGKINREHPIVCDGKSPPHEAISLVPFNVLLKHALFLLWYACILKQNSFFSPYFCSYSIIFMKNNLYFLNIITFKFFSLSHFPCVLNLHTTLRSEV